jgi:hypothetical protein
LKKQFAVCTGLLLLGFATAGTAGAQAVYTGSGRPDPVLPAYEIMSIVRSTGLAPLTRPMRRGPYYVLVAVDRVGRQMRVVVDAQLGDIVNLRPALAAGSYDPELARPNVSPGVAVPPPPNPSGAAAAYGSHPSGGNSPVPLPPGSIPNEPNPRAAAAPPPAPPPAAPPPTRVAVAEPALPPPPPLPRPRPKLALNEAPAAGPAPAAPAETPAGLPAAPSTAPRAAVPSVTDPATIE